jgi:hypothetical protein
MTPAIGAATSGSRPELISATHRRLQRMGFADPQAANLTALMNGVGISSQPWTVRELAHLLFLRESSRVGRLWSDADDRVHGSDGTRVAAPRSGNKPRGRLSRRGIDPTGIGPMVR